MNKSPIIETILIVLFWSVAHSGEQPFARFLSHPPSLDSRAIHFNGPAPDAHLEPALDKSSHPFKSNPDADQTSYLSARWRPNPDRGTATSTLSGGRQSVRRTTLTPHLI